MIEEMVQLCAGNVKHSERNNLFSNLSEKPRNGKMKYLRKWENEGDEMRFYVEVVGWADNRETVHRHHARLKSCLAL